MTGSGYPAGDELVLRQCLGRDSSSPCDQARPATVTVGRDGAFDAPFTVSSEILTDDGWVACTTCHLQVTGYPLPPEQLGQADACRAAGARCVLAWYPHDGGPPVFTTQLRLQG